MDGLYEDIGKRICSERKKQGLTQEQLAEKLDITIKHVSSVERGKSSLSIEKFIELTNILDCSLDYLIRGISYNNLPASISTILSSNDETEKNYLYEYLKLYSKLRNK